MCSAIAACILGVFAFGISAARAADLRAVDAAQRGEFTLMKTVLNRSDVNVRAPDGSTALLWAVYHVSVPAVHELLAAGADANAGNRYGVTPVLEACRVGSPAIFEALLKAGASVRVKYPFGETPLMDCAYTGNLAGVKQLIAHGENVNAREQTEDETALMMAAEQGHLAVVKSLLAAGALPNLVARDTPLHNPKTIGGAVKVDYPRGGMTALMFAAREGHGDVVKALLRAGANPRLKTPDGLSAMVLAVVNDRLDLAKVLLDHGADPNDGSLTAVVDLYNLHAYSTAHSATRTRPWHKNSITPIVLLTQLLNHGANPARPAAYTLNASGPNWTVGTANPAYVAALMGQDAAILKIFLSRKLVTANAIPAYRPAPAVPGAMGPIRAPHADATPLLTALTGAGVRRGLPGSPFGPFRYAGDPSTRGAAPSAAVLIQYGADVNASDPNGNRPIHIAAGKGDLAAIRLLASHGALLKVKDKAGLTPLDYAMGRRPPASANRHVAFIRRPPKPQMAAVALLKQLMSGAKPLKAEKERQGKSGVPVAQATARTSGQIAASTNTRRVSRR